MKTETNNINIFVSLLTVAFIVLKLCHVINWCWWLVLAPLWGGIAAFFLFGGILLLIALVMDWVK